MAEQPTKPAAPAKPPPKARAVHGRMVDVITGVEYGQSAYTLVTQSSWVDAQVEAGKMELE